MSKNYSPAVISQVIMLPMSSKKNDITPVEYLYVKVSKTIKLKRLNDILPKIRKIILFVDTY